MTEQALPQKPVVILGAGCAGLTAAYQLTQKKIPVIIIEKENCVGGLARGILFDGNIYEFGPHIFHSPQADLRHWIQELMGSELISYNRTIKIKFHDTYYDYPLPFLKVLFSFSLLTLFKAVASFLYQTLLSKAYPGEVSTAETVLRRSFGDVLYRIFFKDYIQRVWGIPACRLSPDFARERVPRLGAFPLLDRLQVFFRPREKAPKTGQFIERVEGPLFTTKRGFSPILEKLASEIKMRGGEINLGAHVTKLITDKDVVVSIEYLKEKSLHTISPSAVLSTLPITSLVEMIHPQQNETEWRRSTPTIRFRPLVCVGIHLRRSRVLPASLVYYREYSFNRISDFSYFGFKIQPPGTTQLVAELTCGVEDDFWKNDDSAKRAVVNDLAVEFGIRESEILGTTVYKTEHGYPIYELGYESHLQKSIDLANSFNNLAITGRQGLFKYINSHLVMGLAIQAADQITHKLSHLGESGLTESLGKTKCPEPAVTSIGNVA
ncbi:MAG: FAD-dependent oxidoreductase [Elusimicrobia bacterium]|nr:FAD-dependent oxidoreductase [Candidatus Obscuribacterium magneticum]